MSQNFSEIRHKAIGRFYDKRNNEVGADRSLRKDEIELYAEGYTDAVNDIKKAQPQTIVPLSMPSHERPPESRL